METCLYTCGAKKTATLDENTADLNMSYYNSDYAKSSQSSILERIRQLFRENVFYKLEVLIEEINHIKSVPIEEILFALDTLVKNKNEIVYDKYGRIGNIINYQKYYAFQPIEITDTNISIYERSVPVDYKRPDFGMELSKEPPTAKTEAEKMREMVTTPLPTPISPTENVPVPPQPSPNGVNSTAEEILGQLMENYMHAFEPVNPKLDTRERNWYKHFHSVLPHILIEYEMDEYKLKKYVMYHMLDMLVLTDKLKLFQSIYKEIAGKTDTKLPDEIPETMRTNPKQTIRFFIEKYIENRRMKEGGRVALILTVENSWKLFVWKNDVIGFEEGKPSQYDIFARELDRFDIDDENINDFVGFVNMFKDKTMVFKTKNVRTKRNTVGVRCGDSSIRGDVIKHLNSLLQSTKYESKEYKGIFQQGLCVILEILMRYMNDLAATITTPTEFPGGVTVMPNNVYFLSPELAAINDIVKYQR
jgi:hypothetical protein